MCGLTAFAAKKRLCTHVKKASMALVTASPLQNLHHIHSLDMPKDPLDSSRTLELQTTNAQLPHIRQSPDN